MSEDVLLLRNTDNLQQVEDYDIVRKNLLFCWNSWTNKDIGAIKSLIFHKTSQNNRNNIIVWCIWVYLGKKSRRSTSTKYWQLSTSWGLCQRLFYFYEILTAFAKVKIMSELFYFYEILKAFNKLNIMSKVVLLLRNTDNLQQVEDHVRGCSTSTKYWQPSASWRLCQRMFYFYKILTTFNKLKIMSDNLQQIEIVLLLRNIDNLQQVEDYVSGCSTSTKYWQPSTS